MNIKFISHNLGGFIIDEFNISYKDSSKKQLVSDGKKFAEYMNKNCSAIFIQEVIRNLDKDNYTTKELDKISEVLKILDEYIQ